MRGFWAVHAACPIRSWCTRCVLMLSASGYAMCGDLLGTLAAFCLGLAESVSCLEFEAITTLA